MTASCQADEKKTAFKEKLDHFYNVVKDQLLKFQHPISGLFPLNPRNPKCKYSHIRDSVYCATALWALHQCYARVDDEKGRYYELGQCAVKCMRAILIGLMQQSSRVEQFKTAQSVDTCLQPRLNCETGEPIYDPEYRNLQIDCIGLFIIQLAQMIKSGLQIVYTRDEVAFMQNLVFYLERAYRIPDYGMWERGTKQNRNLVELNASSIGMAKAALESVSGLNIYGAEGSHSTILSMDIDAHSRNRIILTNLLPRESASKGTDAGLIPALCWPAYSISRDQSSTASLARCLERLKGRFGFKRFTRDGYATVLDRGSIYPPGELMKFVGIESEWPMFFAYMVIEHCMNGQMEEATTYDNQLHSLMVHPLSDLYPWLPKFFFVPPDDLEEERKQRGSVTRKSSFRFPGEDYFLWGQSIYIISQMLISGCLTPGDLDPLGRCPSLNKYSNGSGEDTPPLPCALHPDAQDQPLNLTIQVVLISESTRLQQILATFGILTQTPLQVEPIQIWPPDQLILVGKYLGCSRNLGLSGRPPRPVGQLGTSRFYRISGLTVLCYPLLFEAHEFYLLHDMKVVIDEVKTDFKFLSDWWRLSGRPTFCFLLKEDMIKGQDFGQLLRFLVSMKNGTVHGTRVVLGRAQNFVSSGCVEHLDFLPLWTSSGDHFHRLQEVDSGQSFRSLDDLRIEVKPTSLSDAGLSLSPGDKIVAMKDSVKVMHAIDYLRFGKLSDDQLIFVAFQPGDDAVVLATRVAAMHQLLERHDLDYSFTPPKEKKSVSIRAHLLELSRLGGIQQSWCVVRLCCALLKQSVNSLAPSLSVILVCGKQVTAGVARGNEILINKPLNPGELHQLLCNVYRGDPVQFSLQQEVLLWVSGLLTANSSLFNGIKFIRLGWLLEAMKLQLEREYQDAHPQEGADQHLEQFEPKSGSRSDLPAGEAVMSQRSFGACHLYTLAPCVVKDLLQRTLQVGQTQSDTVEEVKVTGMAYARDSEGSSRQRRSGVRRQHHTLSWSQRSTPRCKGDEQSHSCPPPTPLFQRLLDGCLGRVPSTFYQAVYLILERSPCGVLFCEKLLPQKPTLTDMTAYDLNFVDEVELLLRPIGDPAYRSLFVETVMVVAVILQRNHELSFKEVVDIKLIIQDALNSFAHDRKATGSGEPMRHSARRPSWPDSNVVNLQDLDVFNEFAATAPNTQLGTTSYLAKATLDRLLHGQINLSGVTKETCSMM